MEEGNMSNLNHCTYQNVISHPILERGTASCYLIPAPKVVFSPSARPRVLSTMRTYDRQCLDNIKLVDQNRFHASGTAWQTPGEASSCLYCTMGWSAPGSKQAEDLCYLSLGNG